MGVKDTAMNKIVRDHYPVANLPEDLRAELGGIEAAKVTVEAIDPEARASRPLADILEKARRLRRDGTIASIPPEEAVARIRALRDEWD